MADQQGKGISWTHYTANPWWGCVKVSPLCDHCYADTLDRRYGESHFGVTARRRFIKSVWNDVPRWHKAAQESGERKRVFVMSMGDFFEQLPEGHPDKLAMHIVRREFMDMMVAYPGLDFLVLTKRVANVPKMVPEEWLQNWPRHIRLGVSVGTQADADREIPRLLALPCPNFLSMEPLLEYVDISEYLEWSQPDDNESGLHFVARRPVEWVITGGESGPGARPSHPEWFRKLRDDCVAAGVPFHFKQWGNWQYHVFLPGVEARASTDPKEFIFPAAGGSIVMRNVGKEKAGHLLDGKEWQQFPKVLEL